MKRIILLLLLSITTSSNAGVVEYYMASDYKLEDSTRYFNDLYNGIIEDRLKDLNKSRRSRSCESVLKKIRPKFGGFFKSKKIPLQVLDKNPNIDHFPPVNRDSFKRQIDENGLYLGVQAPAELKRIFNIAGVNVGTDKFAHFFELGSWYYKRYFKKLKKYKKRKSELVADLMARRNIVEFGLKLEEGITGRLMKMLSYGDLEANYQGFLFYKSLCHGDNPRLKKINKKWKLVRPLDFNDYFNPYLDDSFSLGDYKSKYWKKVQPNLKKICKINKSENFHESREHYKKNYKDSFSMRTVKELLKEGKTPSPVKYSLEAQCGEDYKGFDIPMHMSESKIYELGGRSPKLDILLPGKPQLKLDFQENPNIVDDRTTFPGNITVDNAGQRISWVGGLLPLYRYFSYYLDDKWSDPKKSPISFKKIPLRKRAFPLHVVSSSIFANGKYITGNKSDDIVITSVATPFQKRGALYFYKRTNSKDKKGRSRYAFIKKMINKDFGIKSRNGLMKHQRVSPDGKWLTFYSRGAKVGSGVYLHSFVTGKTYRISSNDDKHPTFSPDGKKIFFHWQLGGNSTTKTRHKFELSYLGHFDLDFKGEEVSWKRVMLDIFEEGVYHYQKHATNYPGTNLIFSHGRTHPYRGGMQLYVRDITQPEKKWAINLTSLDNGEAMELSRTKHPSHSYSDTGLFFVGRNTLAENNKIYYLTPDMVKHIEALTGANRR